MPNNNMEQQLPMSRPEHEKPQVGLNRPGSPYSQDECEEIIAKLEELLDGELAPEQEEQVTEMVNSCEYCLEQYKLEKSMRKLIKNGFSNLKVSSSLVSGIRDRINGLRRGSSPAQSAK